MLYKTDEEKRANKARYQKAYYLRNRDELLRRANERYAEHREEINQEARNFRAWLKS